MAQKNAVTVEHVSKNFILPHEKATKVKDLFTSAFRKRSKGEDVQHALRDISFSVGEGEFFGIVGRNGSGKSTMLKMLAGIYQPTKGKLRVRGKLVPFIELGVGFNPELTGRENVFLNGAMMGFSKKETAAMYNDIVAFAELHDFMDQKLKNYSSGMQVRLAFSVAIKAEADVLLVDEVLAVGDADFQRKCYQYFKALKQRKKTVIFVTHDMGAVQEYCDRAILIDDGRIAHTGAPDMVANEYLRLFNTSTEEQIDPNAIVNRWGSGQVRFTHVTVKQQPDMVSMTFDMAAETATEGVVVGFRIKDAAGTILTGANSTQDAATAKIAFRAGEKKTLTCALPNIFGGGTFSVDATIRLSDGVTIYDNWDSVASFKKSARGRPNFAVAPPVTFALMTDQDKE